MVRHFKPLARAMKFNLLRARAEHQRERPITQSLPLAFVIGCGRSGTTILGKMMQRHPDLFYHFEPYHLWAAADPTTDMINLYHDVDASCVLDAADASHLIATRIERLLVNPALRTDARVVVEKTPINAMRIGYLNAMFPNARLVHIVRNGSKVIRSIDRLARNNSYRIAGKPNMNQWWGVADAKWNALRRDCERLDCFADEIDLIENDDHLARGAVEWLMSLQQVDNHRHVLGNRLLEITYHDLINTPQSTLRMIAEHIGVSCNDAWVEDAAAMVSSREHQLMGTIELPPNIASAFNEMQYRYEFSGAIACESKPSFSESVLANEYIANTCRQRPARITERSMLAIDNMTQ